MEAKELMMEDWVLYGRGYAIVKRIKPSRCDILVRVTPNHDDIVIETYDNIDPIPLTPQILEKNGFVGEGDKFKMWTSADKRVILHNNDGYLNTFNKWHVHVDTEDMRTIGSIELTDVHQLQQFLRLCGLDNMANNFKV